VFTKLWSLAQALPEAHWPSVSIGLASLAAMLALRRFAPRWPAALVVAALATSAIALLRQGAAGIDIVGALPSGLPHFTPPRIDLGLLTALLPGALSIVLVGYAEALGAAEAASDGEVIAPDQELVAHGLANAASGLLGGFLVVGSLS
jgi:MFS superfamily sulfate permease-like transporter